MENEQKEPVKVYLVNPPSENPWRTQQDYLEDQRRAKFQFWLAIAVAVLSLASVIATAIVAIESLKRMSSHQSTANEPARTQNPKLLAKGEQALKSHIEYLKSGKIENGVLQWGAIRNLSYEIKDGATDETLTASLAYEEDFSLTFPFNSFTNYSRRELELTYTESKWWITGGRHRSFAPAGEKNPAPDWTPFTKDNSTSIAMQLRMGYSFK